MGTGKILTAITKPKDVPEIMHKMAGVTFVQSVESPALAMVVPLLLRGLREKSTATKRQSAVIIDNMSKLVDNPIDAAPFLPLLLPALKTNAESIADPEARATTEKAVAQLERLKGLADKQASVRGDRSKLVEEFKQAFKAEDCGEGLSKIMEHASIVATCMGDLSFMDDLQWKKNISTMFSEYFDAATCESAVEAVRVKAEAMLEIPEEDDEDDDAEQLCDCTFTLAYGTKILLHNTQMKLKRGHKYGLLGGNDCGKTTLMRSISNGQLEGFPPADEVKTVFVEADILGELSHYACIDYIFNDPRIQACGSTKDEVAEMMLKVGFSKKMMAEPTNHLDVMNVKWVKDYIKSLTNVTCIMVSHDSGLLNDVCNHILEIAALKLACFKGNLAAFVKVRPEARAYFELKSNKLKFHFPMPGPIEGVKSKGKALIKVVDVSFKYPRNDKVTIEKATVQVSLSSRVACIGPNGAGKSTLIKCLTGEVQPTTGTVWQHPNARIGYIAQHAFHHIEQHMDKTPNEYIRWRYAGGEDREAIAKDTMKISDAELELQKTVIDFVYTDPDTAKTTKTKRVIKRLTGERKTNKSTKENDYEVQFKAPHDGDDCKHFYGYKKLVKWVWDKACKKVDVKVAQAASGMFRPLTSSNVESHLKNVGLDAEFATHHRISALSGGQKVKVVLGAAMWMQPHLVILDEPTNYLDRESLGALADAIREFEGGVVIISHNNDFTTALCPETWVVEKDEDEISRPNCRGDPEWMKNALATKCDDQQAITEVTDAYGNVTEIKAKKTLTKKEIKKMTKEIKAKIKSGAELDEDEEAFAEEHELWK